MKKTSLILLSLLSVMTNATASGVTVNPLLVKGVLHSSTAVNLMPETYWHHGYERMAYGMNGQFSLLLTTIPKAQTVLEVTRSGRHNTECRFVLDYDKAFSVSVDNSIDGSTLNCGVEHANLPTGFELIVSEKST